MQGNSIKKLEYFVTWHRDLQRKRNRYLRRQSVIAAFDSGQSCASPVPFLRQLCSVVYLPLTAR